MYYCKGCFIELDCEYANVTEEYCKNPRKDGEELEDIDLQPEYYESSN